VKHQHVAGGILEDRHVADAAVDRLALELDAPLLELGARRLDFVDEDGDEICSGDPHRGRRMETVESREAAA
jgi:hypothetical protein